MTAELMRCPFCGNTVNPRHQFYNIRGHSTAVCCGSCGTTGPWVSWPHPTREDEAVAKWNQRAAAPPADQGEWLDKAIDLINEYGLAIQGVNVTESHAAWRALRRHLASRPAGGEPQRQVITREREQWESWREPWNKPIRAHHLDGHLGLFGWKFLDALPEGEGQVVIYIEDDEFWHEALSFSRYWLREFHALATALLPSAMPVTNPPAVAGGTAHKAARLRDYLSKASFASEADRFSALECLQALEPKP
jgi:Lar family restriction alleviation protein